MLALHTVQLSMGEIEKQRSKEQCVSLLKNRVASNQLNIRKGSIYCVLDLVAFGAFPVTGLEMFLMNNNVGFIGKDIGNAA